MHSYCTDRITNLLKDDPQGCNFIQTTARMTLSYKMAGRHLVAIFCLQQLEQTADLPINVCIQMALSYNNSLIVTIYDNHIFII